MACFPRTLDTDIIKDACYVFTATWVIFGGLTPLTISIVVPIVVLCYVRCSTITEGSSYNKGIAKFTLFLVAGNLMNIIGQAVVALIVYVMYIHKLYVYCNVETKTPTVEESKVSYQFLGIGVTTIPLIC